LSIGYWFSLGHSTIVIAIGIGIVVAEKTVFPAVSNNGSGLETFGGIFGTVVSASFLYPHCGTQCRHPRWDLAGLPLDATR
jgi:high-affinity nickel-transport protein